MKKTTFTLITAAALAMIGFSPSMVLADDNAIVLKKLGGTWKGGVVGGAQGHALTFSGKAVAGKQGKNDLGGGFLTLDTSKTPWTLDAKGTKGGHKGKDRLGILTIEGDSLKWCVSLGATRPTKFETGSGNFCLSLKKQK
jgi:uncharacterized protein (TIGR03067 family)